MRIVVANWSSRKVGGTESYLDEIMCELSAIGHDLAFVYESDSPTNRPRIHLPQVCPTWCVAEIGKAAAVTALRRWQPDLVYTHKLLDTAFQEEILSVAPGVLFVHDYDGLCISGSKTFKFPVYRPCSLRFGWKCLIHYFPHRCGGRSPMTMWKLFEAQSRRLRLLHRYRALITHSSHMRAELLKHGISVKMIYKASYLIESSRSALQAASADFEEGCRVIRDQTEAVRLLFSGRMDRLKGGLVLLDALPLIAADLRRQVGLTLVGDGPDRNIWEERAKRVQALEPRVRVEFTGWLEMPRIGQLFAESTLLVMPSLWPEPFGRIGPEAGLYALPVAAFAVGGITEWLIDGVNGYLASADPPTSVALAEAVQKCLQDPDVYNRLRQGAFAVARQFSLANHMSQIVGLFESVVDGSLNPVVGDHHW